MVYSKRDKLQGKTAAAFKTWWKMQMKWRSNGVITEQEMFRERNSSMGLSNLWIYGVFFLEHLSFDQWKSWWLFAILLNVHKLASASLTKPNPTAPWTWTANVDWDTHKEKVSQQHPSSGFSWARLFFSLQSGKGSSGTEVNINI